MPKGLAIWTEGGPSIGMGHVMRCLSVAKAAKDLGMAVRLYINDEAGAAERPVEAAVRGAGFEASVLPFGSSPDAMDADVVLIDTQRDVRGHVMALKGSGRKAVLIDNYSASDIADNVIIPYAALGARPSGKNFLSGPRYLIVGENFLSAREAAQRSRYCLPLRVLVTMGGADPNNLTEMVVEALLVSKAIDVTVVTGPAYRGDGKLERLISAGNGRFRLLHAVKDMAPLMDQTHIAVTALGITVYELAYMGVPSIIIGNYQKDKADISELERLGICIGLGFHRDVNAFRIGKAIQCFMRERSRWERMSRTSAELTDGLGSRRIAGVLSALAGHIPHSGYTVLSPDDLKGGLLAKGCSNPVFCLREAGNL